jgi:hypothetical protein
VHQQQRAVSATLTLGYLFELVPMDDEWPLDDPVAMAAEGQNE